METFIIFYHHFCLLICHLRCFVIPRNQAHTVCIVLTSICHYFACSSIALESEERRIRRCLSQSDNIGGDSSFLRVTKLRKQTFIVFYHRFYLIICHLRCFVILTQEESRDSSFLRVTKVRKGNWEYLFA